MTVLLTCSAVRQLLAAFHDNELPFDNRIAVQGHLDDCWDCRQLLRGFEEVRAAVRLAAAAAPIEEWTGLQPGVIGRMRAEAHESWAARAGRFFDDLHLVWIGLAATAATFLCGAVALSALHFGSPERRGDSLAAAIAVMAAPSGSDLNPVRLGDYIQAPSVPKEGPMEAMLLTQVSDEELMLALSAVVTREGRVSELAVLNTDSDRREINAILAGISQASLEPARFGTDPIAVNLVWLLTHTTVKAKAPRAI